LSLSVIVKNQWNCSVAKTTNVLQTYIADCENHVDVIEIFDR